MGNRARQAVFAAVTLAGLLAFQVITWMWIGPFWGLILVFTGLAYAYRAVAVRLYATDTGAGVLALVSWWGFAACCMLGGVTGGFLTASPERYLEASPIGPPWGMIGIGTAAGAALGLILVGLIRVLARLSPTRPPPAS